MSRRFYWLALPILASLILFLPVFAQSETPTTLLSTPDTSDFPKINAALLAYNPQGAFWHGLTSQNVEIIEDGQTLPVDSLQEERVGVQLVVVFNPGASFLIRDAQGSTRYDLIIEKLVTWARDRLGSTVDDLSMVVTDGPGSSHVNNPLELFYTLSSYQIPDEPAPNLDIVSKAVDLAADNPPRSGMHKVVLLITSPLTGDLALGYQEIIARANQNQVMVDIWLVAPEENLSEEASFDLNDLARQTQGSLITISKQDEIPNLETILKPLRDIYNLQYTSRIKNGGIHEISANLNTSAGKLSSSKVSFNFELKPPDPVFIEPVSEIKRNPAPKSSSGSQASTDELVPSQYPLHLLIDFPDGRSRPLVRSRLYVDGAVAVETYDPPFDSLTWNLSDYLRSGQHVLQAEVQDNLGLVGKTIQLPVYVKVNRPFQSPVKFLASNLPAVGISVILFSAAILFLVLIMGGRINPQDLLIGRNARLKRAAYKDPLTQPVMIKREPPTQPLPAIANRMTRLEPLQSAPALAYLARLANGKDSSTVVPVPITSPNLTIGKNPTRADFVIDDPSVENLHARLLRREDGTFRILDEGSLSGTWVNYTPVSREGVAIENGDLVHFGRVGYRFTLRAVPGSGDEPAAKPGGT